MTPQTLSWLVLTISIMLETAGTLALKQSHGLTRAGPAALAAVCYVCAVWLMGVSMRHMEMGMAYAVWAAGSTALTVLAGAWVLGEHLTPMQWLGLMLVGAGVATLNLSDAR